MIFTLLPLWCWINSTVSALLLWTKGEHKAKGQIGVMEQGWQEIITEASSLCLYSDSVHYFTDRVTQSLLPAMVETLHPHYPQKSPGPPVGAPCYQPLPHCPDSSVCHHTPPWHILHWLLHLETASHTSSALLYALFLSIKIKVSLILKVTLGTTRVCTHYYKSKIFIWHYSTQDKIIPFTRF